MSTAHDLALKLAVHKVLADQLKGVHGELDEQARQVMEPGDRVTAKLPSGERVGSVTLAQGRVTAWQSGELAGVLGDVLQPPALEAGDAS